MNSVQVKEEVDQKTHPGEARVQVEQDVGPGTNTHGEIIALYVDAMSGASGLDREQAKTCVYYALATYYLKEFPSFPILLLQGNAGTGKTKAMEQFSKMVDRARMINGRTKAAVRDELGGVRIAIIDEGDTTVHGLEELLTRRYSTTNSKQMVKRIGSDGSYYSKTLDMFGATVVCRRKPFRDVAMQSRAIVIGTRKRRGTYRITDITTLKQAASQMKPQVMATSDRVGDVWEPLLAVARAVGDIEWLEYAERQVQSARRLLGIEHGIEPNNAVVWALKACCEEHEDGRVRLSELKLTLRDMYDVRLSISQIVAICQQFGIPIVNPHGYMQAKVDPERMGKLVMELETEIDEEDVGGEKTGEIQ